MIKLERSMNNKWIIQKNTSSKDIIEAFVDVLEKSKDVDTEAIKNSLREQGVYHGRSVHGSSSTMGVRFSQICYYMFGYKVDNNLFMPSPTSINMLRKTSDFAKNMLVNLFSMQYPHPYSDTPQDFRIYMSNQCTKTW